MKYHDGRNDQHTSDLDKGGEKAGYANLFKKKLQIAIKIRNKCPIGINVH